MGVRHHGFIALQVLRTDQAGVCWDNISRLQKKNISRHKLRRRNIHETPIPQNMGSNSGQFGQSSEYTPGATLISHKYPDVHDGHPQDDQCIDPEPA
jgi:hypothetical protein